MMVAFFNSIRVAFNDIACSRYS